MPAITIEDVRHLWTYLTELSESEFEKIEARRDLSWEDYKDLPPKLFHLSRDDDVIKENASFLEKDPLLNKFGIAHSNDFLFERLPDRRLSLGPMLRVVLCRYYLPVTSQDAFRTAVYGNSKKGKTVLAALQAKSKEDTRRLHGKSVKRILDHRLTSALARALTNATPIKPHPIDGVRLFSENFCGKDAVDDFLNWLSTGRIPLADNLSLRDNTRAQKFLESAKRSDFLNRLQPQLFGISGDDSPAPKTPMLISLRSRGMWGGLSALTLEIERMRNRCKPSFPICYIPLLHSGNGAGGLGYCEMVAHIAAFFRRVPTASLNTPVTNDEIVGLINEIRRRMQETPALLIFDGYSDVDIGFYHIGRVITDNYVADFVSRLLEPTTIDNANAPFDVSTFRKNRIVILSDEEVTHAGADNKRFASLAGFEHYTDFVPQPPAEKMEEIVLWQKLPHSKEIKRLRSEVEELSIATSEAVFVALATLLSFDKQALKEEPEVYSQISGRLRDLLRNASGDDILHKLLDSILERLRDEDPELVFGLIVIALGPGGVRESTLLRLLEAWRSLDLKKSELSAFRSDLRRDEEGRIHAAPPSCRAQVRRLLECLRPILTPGRDDFLAGFDDRLPPGEVARNIDDPDSRAAADLAPQATRAIDFTVPEFRQAILKMITENTPHSPNKAPLVELSRIVHRLLAEENLRQQTIVFRNMSFSLDDDLRAYRRIVAAIYHTMKSLPYSQTRNRFGAPSDVVTGGTIPHEPAKAWEWAAGFCYRRILERAPEFRLTRRFSADRVKMELLLIMAAPWATDRANAMELYKHKLHTVYSCFAAIPDGAERIEAARRDQLISLAQTEFLLGENDLLPALEDLLGVRKVSTLARSMKAGVAAPPIVPGEYNLKIAKRLFDKYNAGSDFTAAAALWDRLRDPVQSQIRLSLSGSGKARGQGKGSSYQSFTACEFIDFARTHFESLLTNTRQPCGALLGREVDFLSGKAEIHIHNQSDGSDPDTSTPDQWYKRLADISAIYNRRAENLATEADMKLGEMRLTDQSAKNDAIIRQLCDALAHFAFAEQIRLFIFDQQWTGNAYLLSGHSTRTMIRTCLKLATLCEAEQIPPGDTFFARYARRMADIWSRALYRFGRERASMLIMEVTMGRLLASMRTPPPHEKEEIRRLRKELTTLSGCIETLRHAEPLILSLGAASRAHMRFLLERVKVYRRLAEIHQRLDQLKVDQQDRPGADLFRKLAAFDLDLLGKHVEHHGLRYWEILLLLQRRKFAATFATSIDAEPKKNQTTRHHLS